MSKFMEEKLDCLLRHIRMTIISVDEIIKEMDEIDHYIFNLEPNHSDTILATIIVHRYDLRMLERFTKYNIEVSLSNMIRALRANNLEFFLFLSRYAKGDIFLEKTFREMLTILSTYDGYTHCCIYENMPEYDKYIDEKPTYLFLLLSCCYDSNEIFDFYIDHIDINNCRSILMYLICFSKHEIKKCFISLLDNKNMIIDTDIIEDVINFSCHQKIITKLFNNSNHIDIDTKFIIYCLRYNMYNKRDSIDNNMIMQIRLFINNNEYTNEQKWDIMAHYIVICEGLLKLIDVNVLELLYENNFDLDPILPNLLMLSYMTSSKEIIKFINSKPLDTTTAMITLFNDLHKHINENKN
jgi:hypothetical protein